MISITARCLAVLPYIIIIIINLSLNAEHNLLFVHSTNDKTYNLKVNMTVQCIDLNNPFGLMINCHYYICKLSVQRS